MTPVRLFLSARTHASAPSSPRCALRQLVDTKSSFRSILTKSLSCAPKAGLLVHAWCAILHGRSVHRRFRLAATLFRHKYAFQFRSTQGLAFSTRTRLMFPSTSISASACCHHLNVSSCDLSLDRDDGIAPPRHPSTVAHWPSPSGSSGCFAASRSAAQLPH